MTNDEKSPTVPMTNRQTFSLFHSDFVVPSSLDIRASSFKMSNAFAMEKASLPAGMAGAFPCHKAHPIVFAKGLLSSCQEHGCAA
jgi:hypothetical protein